MVKEIVRDIFFLGQKSELATKADLQVGKDLQDTLNANREHCVGMAANMIGVKKRVIIVNLGIIDIVMFNPVLTRKDTPYQTEEGCLSLDGVRPTTRYKHIEVEYFDFGWKKQRKKLSDWPAQICQHELDHLEGIII
ncbi:peptide deformylase [Faecalimonas sp.]